MRKGNYYFFKKYEEYNDKDLFIDVDSKWSLYDDSILIFIQNLYQDSKYN